ncbi:hypothetical protein TNCV_1932401 [Trichonephila clavipes]|nr:hypothetical protein TNCV_1932401 [Trichonephila clavipes]
MIKPDSPSQETVTRKSVPNDFVYRLPYFLGQSKAKKKLSCFGRGRVGGSNHPASNSAQDLMEDPPSAPHAQLDMRFSLFPMAFTTIGYRVLWLEMMA